MVLTARGRWHDKLAGFDAGADDFLVHVGVRDSDALRDFAMNALTTRPEVSHLETGLIFSCVEAGDE